MGDIEKYGTGFVRIRQWLKDYPEISYEISEIGDFFRIVLECEGDILRQVPDKCRTSAGQVEHHGILSHGAVCKRNDDFL